MYYICFKMMACILSGGKALRLNGQTKSHIIVGEKPLLEWQLAVLRKYFEEIVIIGRITHPEARTFFDIIEGIGPMGGLYTALKVTKKSEVFIFPSDNPFLSGLFIETLIHLSQTKQQEAIIPLHYGYAEPLYGLYRISILPKIEKMLNEKRYAMHELLQKINAYYFEWNKDPEITFFNINYPEDIRKAQHICQKV
ncbi:MAG: molybdenum cofactor guanylyltransferase [Bacteroidales bacterium]|nr:molybdenum cofactor guanylyltransferase [Bacteroidales bacterium]